VVSPETTPQQAFISSKCLPNVCPHGRCTDPVPEDAQPALVAMFKLYKKLIRKHGVGSATPLWNHAFAIHLELDKINKRGPRSKVANMKGWPTNPRFRDIPDRIIAMKRELTDLVYQKGVSGPGFMQDQFRALLERNGFGSPPNLYRLARSQYPPSEIFDASRPG